MEQTLSENGAGTMSEFTEVRQSNHYYKKPTASENAQDQVLDALDGVHGFCHFNAEGRKDFISRVGSYRVENGVLEIRAITFREQTALIKICFVSENTYRLQMFPFAKTPERLNPVFEFPVYARAEQEEDDTFLLFKTRRVTLRIRKCPWEVNVELDGKELTRQQIRDFDCGLKYRSVPLGYTLNDGKITDCFETMNLYADESFYGFGEKFTPFNKRGQVITVWQKDCCCTDSTDSYKAMPYFFSSNGYSVILNTFTRTHFNMGQASYVSYNMETEDPYIDYYMICNRSYKGLLHDYLDLSGRSPLIPRWAFGFWMSKMSYMTRAEVEETVDRMERFGMSADVIHIDGWGAFGMDGKPDLLTFDETRFPDPEGMIAGLRKKGVRLSLWMFPYVIFPGSNAEKQGHRSAQFDFCRERGYLVKNKAGEVCILHNGLTPETDGGIAFFDFTNPEARAYMKERVKRLMRMGVGVIKTDFSEDIPEDAVFYDGVTGVEGHNRYTLQYARCIYEASAAAKAETGERALLWGRSGYLGSQRYPANWAGDSSAATNNLAAILNGGLSMGLSGVSFWGFDIGGFYNCNYEGERSMPSAEDYIRSVQMGLMAPLSRAHGQATPREPWNYPAEAQKAFLKINKFRYSLLPYIYSAAYETHLYGDPMMRAMLLEFQDDRCCRDISTQYMYGGSLLVAPTFDQPDQQVYLPAGQWVDLNRRQFCSRNGWVSVEKDLQRIPLFLRENRALVFLNETPMHIEEKVFTGLKLTVNIRNHFTQPYYDDGVETAVACALEDGVLTISTPQMDVTALEVYCLENIRRILLNGKEMPFTGQAGRYLTE